MYVRAEENWGIEGWQRQPRLRLSD
jgi:hypothetical protein